MTFLIMSRLNIAFDSISPFADDNIQMYSHLDVLYKSLYHPEGRDLF
jgi:hypothetical protein